MGFIDAFIHCWHYFCQVRSGNTDKLNIISFQQNQQHKINLSTQLIFDRILTKTVVQLNNNNFNYQNKIKNMNTSTTNQIKSNLDIVDLVQLRSKSSRINRTKEPELIINNQLQTEKKKNVKTERNGIDLKTATQTFWKVLKRNENGKLIRARSGRN
ncbi:Hypothetical_protein [Hexamita inflata]|uniref:Hypothetical_protein n=1 Tax=Hexamita inflata TaxID=28002 RepID=A0AA86NCQ8_9EUKA|nr:Hypothetical protein HINF_LOCUS4573 [Hexamita inflata]